MRLRNTGRRDIFDEDRPENRLLCSALDRVCRLTRDAGDWRLAHALVTFLASVPRSSNFTDDFRRWRNDRLLAHYRPARPWCALIFAEQTPLSVLGQWHGISLLFPMEKVFERYVEVCLRHALPADARIKRASPVRPIEDRGFFWRLYQKTSAGPLPWPTCYEW